MPITRRTFMLAAVAGGGHAYSQTVDSGQTERFRPYLQVKTVAGEERMVRVFFSPSCPYSKEYFPFFGNLSKTLPAGRTFAYAPLANATDGMVYLIAFAAVQRYYPAYVSNFVEASLMGVQERRLSPSTWAGLDRIAKAARLPVSLPSLVVRNNTELKDDVKRLLALQDGLHITNTPSVAVAGTYIVTPEFTAGDSSQFSQLVNSVISMTY